MVKSLQLYLKKNTTLQIYKYNKFLFEKEIYKMIFYLDKKFDNMDKKFDNMNKKFDNMNKKVDIMDKRFDNIDKDIKKLPKLTDNDY